MTTTKTYADFQKLKQEALAAAAAARTALTDAEAAQTKETAAANGRVEKLEGKFRETGDPKVARELIAEKEAREAVTTWHAERVATLAAELAAAESAARTASARARAAGSITDASQLFAKRGNIKDCVVALIKALEEFPIKSLYYTSFTDPAVAAMVPGVFAEMFAADDLFRLTVERRMPAIPSGDYGWDDLPSDLSRALLPFAAVNDDEAVSFYKRLLALSKSAISNLEEAIADHEARTAPERAAREAARQKAEAEAAERKRAEEQAAENAKYDGAVTALREKLRPAMDLCRERPEIFGRLNSDLLKKNRDGSQRELVDTLTKDAHDRLAPMCAAEGIYCPDGSELHWMIVDQLGEWNTHFDANQGKGITNKTDSDAELRWLVRSRMEREAKDAKHAAWKAERQADTAQRVKRQAEIDAQRVKRREAMRAALRAKQGGEAAE